MNGYEKKLHEMKVRAPFQIGDRFLMDINGYVVVYEVVNMRLHSMRQVGGMSGRTYTVRTDNVGEMRNVNESRLEFLVHKYSVAVLALGKNKTLEERDADYECIVDEDADINPANPENQGGAA